MKKFFRFQLCCICLLVLIVSACKVKRPDSVISESEMENLLYDYHIAKAMGENMPVVRTIKRHCTSKQYSKSMVRQKKFSTHQWYGIPEIPKYYRKSMRK